MPASTSARCDAAARVADVTQQLLQQERRNRGEDHVENDFSGEVTIADVGDGQWHLVFVVSMVDGEVPNMLRMLSV